jgi:hypothetical protein
VIIITFYHLFHSAARANAPKYPFWKGKIPSLPFGKEGICQNFIL